MNNQKSLCIKIHSVLLKEWDPIGINDIQEAKDEYDAYVFPIYKLICSEKSEREIFDYLWQIEIEHMGLSGNKKHTKAIALRLSKLKKS